MLEIRRRGKNGSEHSDGKNGSENVQVAPPLLAIRRMLSDAADFKTKLPSCRFDFQGLSLRLYVRACSQARRGGEVRIFAEGKGAGSTGVCFAS